MPDTRPTRRLRLWWRFLRFFCVVYFYTCYRFRATGRCHIPRSGPVLFVSNHQSYLDPIIVGIGSHPRQFFPMARSTLWQNRLVGWLIHTLKAIPVDRGEADMAAIRKCIEVLKADRSLLLFPEGTRTLDGRTGGFKTGTMLIIKRAKPVVIPVSIQGGHDVWPKGRSYPDFFGRIAVHYAEPIDAQILIDMGPEAAMEHLRKIIESNRLRLEAAGPSSNVESSCDDQLRS